ncbi:MAG: hypothetical protein QOD06_2632 [Candidatus Binatota bacterium]|nr:hypothetical protein [Candidatus Binatota bacterium]
MKPLKSLALAGLLGVAVAMTAPSTASADPHGGGASQKKHEKWHEKWDRKHDRTHERLDHDQRGRAHERWEHDHGGANRPKPSHPQVGRNDRRYDAPRHNPPPNRPRYDPRYNGPRYDPRNDGRYGRRYDGRYGRNDACGPIGDRIRRDQTEIGRWRNSGRHENAVDWYQRDLQDAYNDLRVCRGQARYGGGGEIGPYYGDTSYDPYYGGNQGYPYGSNDGGLDIGGLLNGLLGGR